MFPSVGVVSIFLCCFSLPTQRCFSGQTFYFWARLAFLCLRRGVSRANTRRLTMDLFSLPTQRCFQRWSLGKGAQVLFSAYAEVFPSSRLWGSQTTPFLCLRRGVSVRLDPRLCVPCFSLPTQRCFWSHPCADVVERLFSAYAEVFPKARGWCAYGYAFLCLRRGVSHPLGHGSGVSFFSLPTQRCFPVRFSQWFN